MSTKKEGCSRENIEGINVMQDVLNLLSLVRDKFGTSVNLFCDFHKDDRGEVLMDLRIDDAKKISDKLPGFIKRKTPCEVASTVIPILQAVVAE